MQLYSFKTLESTHRISLPLRDFVHHLDIRKCSLFMYLTDADILEVQVDAGVAGLYLDHLRADFKLEKLKNE